MSDKIDDHVCEKNLINECLCTVCKITYANDPMFRCRYNCQNCKKNRLMPSDRTSRQEQDEYEEQFKAKHNKYLEIQKVFPEINKDDIIKVLTMIN
mgnify:CR=1 FL=1